MINDRAAGLWSIPRAFGRSTTMASSSVSRASPTSADRRRATPVLVQAGQSTGGRDLGATVADMIYTVQPQRDAAIEYYAAYKQNVADHGRHPDNTLILPGLVPYVGGDRGGG